MAVITVRNLDDEVQRRLKQRAVGNNRSMEAEARAILSAAVTGTDFASDWVARTSAFRGEDLDAPARATARELDLS